MTIVTYDAGGQTMAVYVDPSGEPMGGFEQLLRNALDLPGSVRAEAWTAGAGVGDLLGFLER